MQPNVQSAPSVPPASSSNDIAQIQKANKQKLIWGLLCFITPTALLAITLICGLVMTTMADSAPLDPNSTSLFPENTSATSIGNILLFLGAGLSVLMWLPGIIIGTILLTTRKRT